MRNEQSNESLLCTKIKDLLPVDAPNLDEQQLINLVKLQKMLDIGLTITKLAHTIGYLDFHVVNEEMFLDNNDNEEFYFELKESDGSIQKYKGIPLETEADNGVFGNILIAENAPSLKLNFKGTEPGNGSVYSDFEQDGPGNIDYHNQEANILIQIANQIHDISAKYPDAKVNLDIAGHSLGGGLTQIAHASILKAMANEANFQKLGLTKTQQEQFTKIGHITIRIDRPTGVKKEIAADVKKYTREMKEKYGLTTQVNVLWVGGDPVQTSQQTVAYSHIEKEDMFVNLLKVNVGYQGYGFQEFAIGTVGIAASLMTGIAAVPLFIGGAGVMFSKLCKAAYAHTVTVFSEEFCQRLTSAIIKDKQSVDDLKDFIQLFNNSTEEGVKIIAQKFANKTIWNPVVENFGFKKEKKIGNKNLEPINVETNDESEIMDFILLDLDEDDPRREVTISLQEEDNHESLIIKDNAQVENTKEFIRIAKQPILFSEDLKNCAEQQYLEDKMSNVATHPHTSTGGKLIM